MLKKILSLCACLVLAAYAKPEIKITLDKEDHLYKCGEQAVFTVEVTEEGRKLTDKVETVFSLDGGKTIKKATQNLADANPFTLPFDYQGECFHHNRTGKRFVTVVGNSDAETLEVVINLPHGDKALCRGNKDDKWNELPFEGDTLRLPNDSSAYVISL